MLNLSVYADKPSIHFEYIKPSDGLAGRGIWSITQDSKGHIWFGSNNGLSRYNGYKIENFHYNPSLPSSISSNVVSALYADEEDRIWIGGTNTKLQNYKIDVFSKGSFVTFPTYRKNDQQLTFSTINAIHSSKNNLWVGTDKGLIYSASARDVNFEYFDLESPVTERVWSIYPTDNENLLIGTDKSLYHLNTISKHFYRFDLGFKQSEDHNVRSLHQDKDGQIWIGTHNNLYVFNPESNQLRSYSEVFKDIAILSIAANDYGIWVGTFRHGLYWITTEGEIHQYTYKNNFLNSISDENVVSLFNDSTNRLWIGTLNGVNHFYSNTLALGLSKNAEGFQCLESPNITATYELDANHIILGTLSGLYLYNHSGIQCKRINIDENFLSEHSNYSVSFINNFNKDFLVIGANSGRGLLLLNKKTKSLSKFPYQIANQSTLFLHALNDGSYFQGTRRGLYRLTENNKPYEVPLNPDIEEPILFSAAEQTSNGDTLFATSSGLMKYQKMNGIDKLSSYPHLSERIQGLAINDFIWTGSEEGKIYQHTPKGQLINSYMLPNQLPPLDIKGIFPDKELLWVPTNRGLYRMNTLSKNIKKFTPKDGIQGLIFSNNPFHKSKSNKLYFSGDNGFNAFYSDDIKNNLIPPKVTLTQMLLFGKTVLAKQNYNGFSIEQPIEYLDKIILSHKEYVVGFEFAALHFADPLRNQYAYMLEGLRNEWTYTDAGNRTATFTNLKPGQYTFRVKAANKDGIWSEESDNVALTIHVRPAPWFSWWAYLIYTALFLSAISLFIIYRTRAAVARGKKLENEVILRTKEINFQKEVIESLMERKDTLFANISHEFRTPLTLILGPLENELKSLSSPKNPKQLKVIQRNAQRLLGMVEQILKLTELSNDEVKPQVAHSVDLVLAAVVESFKDLAKSKKIHLDLETHSNASVLVTHDALDIVFGNLISNAIKYTHSGGNVNVRSQLEDHTVKIIVEDTGVGMPPNQKDEIFERFIRLDKTSDIAGTGIGLSIVKELVETHQGYIDVESIEGKGSKFTIHLPITDLSAPVDNYSVRAIEHLTYVEPETTLDNSDDLELNNSLSAKNLVLVIDDSLDMREYISHVLSNDYECINAARGLEGFELAKQHVPDLIICDIMMPEMDGYTVARKLREDLVTSHIPLILLTAKGDTQSRISGWNENIDDYMTKPFNESELLARVDNLITIRNILSQKVSSVIHTKAKKNTEQEKVLNKKEQYFLDKFMQVIESNFHDISFKKTNMTELMFVSERQLQRKLRALTNQTPIEILKDYRLKKACDYLLQGETVSRVMEMCGFSSASHFSRSFKAKYDVSPKQYQLNK